MILVDTSIWVDHLRAGNPMLEELLLHDRVLIHPWVVGEVALGSLRHRTRVIGLLESLARATVASHPEIMALIDRAGLHGRGIGYVDAHLLGATLLTPGATLWTGDRRLALAATDLGVSANPN